MKDSAAILIPARDEEETIEAVVAAATALHRHVYVVDDGSVDATAELARQSGATVIECGGHVGFGRALSRGVKELSQQFDLIGTMDADGAHDPADMIRLLRAHVDANAVLTLGCRFADPLRAAEIPSAKRAANDLATSWFNSIVGTELKDVATGMRVLGRPAFALCPNQMSFRWAFDFLAAVASAGHRIHEEPIEVRYDARELFRTTRHEIVEFATFCSHQTRGKRCNAVAFELIDALGRYESLIVGIGSKDFVLHALPDHDGYVIQLQNPWYKRTSGSLPRLRLDPA